LFRVNKTDWSRHTRDWLSGRRVMKINAHYFWLVLLGICYQV
jgi:stearoyl-CoA desaturase (Delta-9 desaturase)